MFAFGLAAIFALITLPVEFDASKRGLRLLQTYNLAIGNEVQGAKAVLDAAALTYVAAGDSGCCNPALLRQLIAGRRDD